MNLIAKGVLVLSAALNFPACGAAPPKPYGVVPDLRQLKWHEMEMYAFAHFGPDTFNDVEWGSGAEKVTDFNPADLDAEQVVRAVKAGGMKGLILTAKHHGGSIAEVSSQNPGMEKEKMHDGAAETFWHTRFDGGFAPPPHFGVLEVPAGTSVAGLSYAAWCGGNGNGHVKSYAISVSDDGKAWGPPLVRGALKTGSPQNQEIRFPAPTIKRLIKFEITDAVSLGGQSIAAIGELDVLLK